MSATKTELKLYIQKWRDNIAAAERLLKELPDDEIAVVNGLEPKRQVSASTEKTSVPITNAQIKIRDWVIKSLESSMLPKTSNVLYPLYKEQVNSKISSNAFSNGVSTHIRNNDPLLKRITLDGVKNEVKYWYVLPEWFDGDDLKDEYKEEIEKALNSAYQR
jgi:hypothetical protein